GTVGRLTRFHHAPGADRTRFSGSVPNSTRPCPSRGEMAINSNNVSGMARPGENVPDLTFAAFLDAAAPAVELERAALPLRLIRGPVGPEPCLSRLGAGAIVSRSGEARLRCPASGRSLGPSRPEGDTHRNRCESQDRKGFLQRGCYLRIDRTFVPCLM